MTFDFSDPRVVLWSVVVVLLSVALVALLVQQVVSSRRTRMLRSRFGPEYDLALRDFRSKSRAEARLLARIERVERLNIRDLDPAMRDNFISQWDAIQLRFLDHPRGAVIEADELIVAVLQARGFPALGFEQRAADLSVQYSHLVGPYRTATATIVRAGRNDATTEELRAAMVHYRSLFEGLVQAKAPVAESLVESRRSAA